MDSASQPIAYLNIIKILSDYKNFRKWLREYHKTTKDKPYLKGYKYLVSICVQWFIESSAMDDIFKFKDDIYFNRANFVGISIDQIPNSSKKVIFYKNVWNLAKPITNAKTWEELENTSELGKLNRIFDVIIQKQAKTNLESLDYALQVTSMFYAYIFLIDTSRGHPKAARSPFFKTKKDPKFLDAAFQGYVYGLQFLWYSLMKKMNLKILL